MHFPRANEVKRVKYVSMTGLRRARLKQFLANQQSYSPHKPAERHSKRSPNYVKVIEAPWEEDLADMMAMRGNNKWHKFIMRVIDIFTKRAWGIAIKNKSGK